MKRVYISADLEGISGIVHGEHTMRNGREHDLARKLMTLEVNAAVEGALEAGADEVVVNDSHGSMRNIFPDQIHKKALLITGSPKPYSMMEGIQDGEYTCAMFVGYHSRAGQHGILNHTYWGTVVRDVKLNGVSMGETGINAAVAGSFGVPLTLVTGDDRVCQEAQDLIPGVLTAEVKQARGRYTAKCLHPELACDLIRQRAKEAVNAQVKPFVLEGPVHLELGMHNTAQTDAASGLPGVEYIDPTTLSFTGENLIQTFRVMRALLTLGGAI